MNLLSPTAYSLLARPLLFRLPPEAAQKVAETLLKRAPLWRSLAPAIRVSDGRLAAETGGLSVLNPVGLAAGFDKNCEMLPSLASLGFGYVVAVPSRRIHAQMGSPALFRAFSPHELLPPDYKQPVCREAR